jgi:hypothetical protein
MAKAKKQSSRGRKQDRARVAGGQDYETAVRGNDRLANSEADANSCSFCAEESSSKNTVSDGSSNAAPPPVGRTLDGALDWGT